MLLKQAEIDKNVKASSIDAIKMLQPYGYKGFLIGENFMKTNEPGLSATQFIQKLKS